jgi:hypothetical protein
MDAIDQGHDQRAAFFFMILHVGGGRRQRHALDHRHGRQLDDLGAEF